MLIVKTLAHMYKTLSLYLPPPLCACVCVLQLVEMLDRMHTPDERLLVVLTCCPRLTDAVEADDQNLFKDIEGAIDPLNLKRCVCVCVRVYLSVQPFPPTIALYHRGHYTSVASVDSPVLTTTTTTTTIGPGWWSTYWWRRHRRRTPPAPREKPRAR